MITETQQSKLRLAFWGVYIEYGGSEAHDDDTLMSAMNLDSLDVTEIVIAIEEECGCQISEGYEFKPDTTLGGLIQQLIEHATFTA